MAATLTVNVLANLGGLNQIRQAITTLQGQVQQGLALPPIALSSAQTFRSSISQATIAVAGLAAALSGLSALMVSSFTSQESAFAGIRKTVDESEAGFQKLRMNLTDLSNRIPVKYEDLSKIGELAGQLGVRGVEDLTRFTETVARVASSSTLSAEAAATGFAKIASAMQEPISNIEKMASALVGLGISTVSTEADILNFAERIAGAGKIAGMTTANIFAIGAAFASVGLKAEAGGTAVQNLITVMTVAAATGGEKLKILAELADVTEEQFRELFKTAPAEAFTQVVNGIGRAGDKASAALEGLAGANQRVFRAFVTAAGSGEKFNQIMAEGNKSWDAQNKHVQVSDERFKTFASTMTVLANAVNNLAASFGETLMPVLQPVIKGITFLVEKFQGLDPTFKTILAAIVGLTAGFFVLLGILGTATIAWSAFSTAAINLGTNAASLIGLFGNIGKVILLLITGITLAIKAYQWWTGATDEQKAAAARLEAQLTKTDEAVAEAGGTAKKAGEETKVSGDQAKAGLSGWQEFVKGWREAMRGIDVHVEEFKESLKTSTNSLLDDWIAAWKRGFLLLGDEWNRFLADLKQDWDKIWTTIKGFVPEVVTSAAEREWGNIKAEWNFYIDFWAKKIAALRETGRKGVSSAVQEVLGPVSTIYDPLTGQQIAGSALPGSQGGSQKSEFNRIGPTEGDAALDAITKAYDKAIAEEKKIALLRDFNFKMSITSEEEYMHARMQGIEGVRAIEEQRFKDSQALAGRLVKGEDDLRKKSIKDFDNANNDLLKLELQLVLDREEIRKRLLTFDQVMNDQRITNERATAAIIVDLRQKQIDLIANLEATDYQRLVRQEKTKAFTEASQIEADLKERGATLAQIAEATKIPFENANAVISDFLKRDWVTKSRELDGLRASFGLLGEEAFKVSEAFRLEKTSYDNLTDAQKRGVDESARYLEQTRAIRRETELLSATQKRATELWEAGMEKTAAAALAYRAETALQRQKDLDIQIKSLQIVNNAYQVNEQQHAQLMMERGQDEANFYKFSIGSLKKWAAEQDTIWQAFDKALSNTLGHIQRSLSDVFFNLMSGKEFKIKDVLKDLLDAMLREIANFMAAAAVKSFIAFLGNLASGQTAGESASGALGSLTGGKAGQSAVGSSASPGYADLGSVAFKAVGSLWDKLSGTSSTSSPMLDPGTSFNSPSGSTGYQSYRAGEIQNYTPPPITDFTYASPEVFGYAFATGGLVPGVGRGDIVPAMLEPGEYVIKRSVAEQMGPTLDKLNEGGAPTVRGNQLHFATGGTVPTIEARSVTTDALLAAILVAMNRQTTITRQVAENTGQSSNTLTTIAKDSGATAAPTAPAWISGVANQGGGDTPGSIEALLNTGVVQGGLRTLGSGASALGFQGGAQALVGLAGVASIVQGLQRDDPRLIASGGLTTASALAGILSRPGVAEALGLTPAQAASAGLISQGLMAGTGVLGLVQGIEQGKPIAAAGGAATTLASISNILASKQAAGLLGYSTGAGSLGQAFGVAGGALGAVGGGLTLYQGIQNEDPAQIALGAYSTAMGTYSTLSTIAPATFTPLSALAADAVIAAAPQTATALGLTGSAGAVGTATYAASSAGVSLGADIGVVAGATGGGVAAGTAASLAVPVVGALMAAIVILGQMGVFERMGMHSPTAGEVSQRIGEWGDTELNRLLSEQTDLKGLVELLNTQFSPHGEVRIGSSPTFGGQGFEPDKIGEGLPAVPSGPLWDKALGALYTPELVNAGQGMPWVEEFVRGLNVTYGQTGVASTLDAEAIWKLQSQIANTLPDLPAYKGIKAAVAPGGDLWNQEQFRLATERLMYSGMSVPKFQTPSGEIVSNPATNTYDSYTNMVTTVDGRQFQLTPQTIANYNINPYAYDPQAYGGQSYSAPSDPNFGMARGGWVPGTEWHGNFGYATGGWISGDEWGRDSVRARLEPGEFVVPRRVASGNTDQLDRLVRTGQWLNNDPTRLVPMSNLGISREQAAPVAGTEVNTMPVNIHIEIHGDVKDEKKVASNLAPMLRDELRRIDPHYSRAGNKRQA